MIANRMLYREMRADRTGETVMKFEGGCYCGQLRYVADGEPMLKAQCHCRECQYISGRSPNLFMLMPFAGFSYTRCTPKQLPAATWKAR